MNLMLATLAADADLQKAQQAFYGLGFVAFSVAVGVAAIVSLLGILYMTLVVSPNVTQRISTALREHNVKSFAIGLPVTGVFAILGHFGQKAPLLGAVTVMVFGVTLVLAFAGAAEDIGRRLSWACGKEGTRASHLASGWLVFAFGSLFPVLGWFLIFPYVAVSGLGSVVVGALTPARPKDIEFPKES